ncbi:MAG: hypothetical protein H7326_06405 [Bdellovibrionaceae bacterium]|nr:hypothetical protein [Pseudobdellovibrionaceae bacterium]
MKKIISLVIFTAALAWTWNIVHSTQAIGFETHSGIQEKLAAMIKKTVLSKKPNAKNFRIARLWTESISETKVRAIFAYEFTELVEGNESTSQTVEGEAVLFREPKDETNLDRWVLQSVKTTNDTVTFSEGMVVTPDAGAEAATPAAGEPTQDTTAPASSEHK